MSEPTTSSAPSGTPTIIRRETRPVRGKLTLAAVLLVAFAIYTWLAVEWSPFIRLDHYLNRNFRVHSFWPVLHIVDRIGQRAICLPILIVVACITGWRHRSWRPLVVGGAAVFLINLIVLIVKLALSRGRPLSGESFFSDGDLYPSGHTANILVVYGCCYYFITHYGNVSERVRRALIGAVCLLSVVMVTTSLLLRWHWFSDLIGGFMVGGAVLSLAIGLDSAIPFMSSRLVVLSPWPPPTRAPEPALTPASSPAPRTADARTAMNVRRQHLGSRHRARQHRADAESQPRERAV